MIAVVGTDTPAGIVVKSGMQPSIDGAEMQVLVGENK
jgi:hypothetical protein